MKKINIDTPIKNFKGLTRENLVEENESPAYIRYKFDNGYGLLVTNKFFEKSSGDKFVETEENPYRVHILKYDDKDNYFVDKYTKATQVKVDDDIFYDYQISCQSGIDVRELIEQVKGYEKTKTLDNKELKEVVKNIVDKSLEKDSKEHKILSEKLDMFGDNELVKNTIKDILKDEYKEQAVCIKNSDIFKKIDSSFEEKGIKRYKDSIKFVEKFSKEEINKFLKIESKFEKEVFEKVGEYLTKDGNYFYIGDESKYRNKLDKEIDNLAKEVKKELKLNDEELIKYFNMEKYLPEFNVFTDNGLAFSSNFKKEIDEQANKEFLKILEENNFDSFSFDIRDIAKIDKLHIYYNGKNDELTNYNGYDKYIENIAEKLANKGIEDKFIGIGTRLKEEVYDLIEICNNPYIEKKEYEKLEKKIDDRIKILNKKNNQTKNSKDMIEKEKNNKKEEIEF